MCRCALGQGVDESLFSPVPHKHLGYLPYDTEAAGPQADAAEAAALVGSV